MQWFHTFVGSKEQVVQAIERSNQMPQHAKAALLGAVEALQPTTHYSIQSIGTHSTAGYHMKHDFSIYSAPGTAITRS